MWMEKINLTSPGVLVSCIRAHFIWVNALGRSSPASFLFFPSLLLFFRLLYRFFRPLSILPGLVIAFNRSQGGSSQSSARQSRSSALPWRSLSKLISYFSSLPLLRGRIWGIWALSKVIGPAGSRRGSMKRFQRIYASPGHPNVRQSF